MSLIQAVLSALIITAILLNPVHGLTCVTCSSCSSGYTQKTCAAGESCYITLDTINNFLTNTIITKGCMPNCTNISLPSSGGAGSLSTNTTCCTTDLCNLFFVGVTETTTQKTNDASNSLFKFSSVLTSFMAIGIMALFLNC